VLILGGGYHLLANRTSATAPAANREQRPHPPDATRCAQGQAPV